MKCDGCGKNYGNIVLAPDAQDPITCGNCGHVMVPVTRREPTKRVRLTLEQYYVMIEELKISLQNLHLVAPPDCQDAFDEDCGLVPHDAECLWCAKMMRMKELIKAVKGGD